MTDRDAADTDLARLAAVDQAERTLPTERGVVSARPDLGGGAASPSFRDAGDGSGDTAWRPDRTYRDAPAPTIIGGRRFDWGERTFVMGVLNVTPDSFSGDGLLAPSRVTEGSAGSPVIDRAVDVARHMVAAGADIIDVGGESTRPGHEVVTGDEEARRVVPVIEALHAALPDVPLSIDTTKPSVAAAALEAGASLLNDVWGVAPDSSLARLAGARGAPIVLMHNRSEARYADVVEEVIDDLRAAIARAVAVGVSLDSIVIDPGFGFGKAPRHNLELLARLDRLHVLGRPILFGASRKSTLGKVLDLPPHERLEATLATTVFAVQAAVDIVRVHDVVENVRAARMADAVVRGWSPPDAEPASGWSS